VHEHAERSLFRQHVARILERVIDERHDVVGVAVRGDVVGDGHRFGRERVLDLARISALCIRSANETP
jgi:hypothetical protein